MIKESIALLVDGSILTRDDARAAMLEIMNGEATPAQIASYITALRIRGETPDIIAGSAEAMRSKFTAVRAPETIVADTCGTGGDGAHTFNISTASAFVAAAAGVVIAKHGNRSVSSKCGSADVLTALGINIEATPEIMAGCLNEIGMAFLFAPSLHPAMKFAIGPRREIGIRSIFNILGPLSNPAGTRHGVLGVYNAALVPVLAEAAAALGAVHLFVVHGRDGLDEITTTAPTLVAEVKRGQVTQYELEPELLGIPRAHPSDLAGGDAQENAAIVRRIFDGEKGPRRDIVLLNAAAVIVAGQKAADLKTALALAGQAIDSGAARAKLEELSRMTKT
ncbi:MAG TPA: anthranilate phosphoribosyltransferase [Verrucomicrobia bacterium]|nr:MAG: anthranilate phosphoribosyltransferase [Lentisphaerae bacterium GWF2_57_35]HBA85841.1 anthranilate phosphoribosyltransferase [Verrucomicrobiota bacterium]